MGDGAWGGGVAGLAAPARLSVVCCQVMRFGLFFQAPEVAGQTHAERFEEMFQLAALAESLGFDTA